MNTTTGSRVRRKQRREVRDLAFVRAAPASTRSRSRRSHDARARAGGRRMRSGPCARRRRVILLVVESERRLEPFEILPIRLAEPRQPAIERSPERGHRRQRALAEAPRAAAARSRVPAAPAASQHRRLESASVASTRCSAGDSVTPCQRTDAPHWQPHVLSRPAEDRQRRRHRALPSSSEPREPRRRRRSAVWR